MLKKIFFISFTCFFSPIAQSAINFEQFFITTAEQHQYQKSGGYIFFQRDFDKNESAMCQIKRLYPSALMMTDQENDVVYRIKHFKLPNHKQNWKDKHTQDKADFVAKELKRLCLDVNLAPMVELSFDNKRSSSNLQVSIDYAKSITKILNNNKIAATWKHFPGGSFNRKPAIQTPYQHLYSKSAFSEGTVIYDDKTSLTPHMESFRHEGANMLMISNSVYPAYSEKPAIFTQELLKKAKNKQPNSLIISDDLEQVRVSKEDIIHSFDHVHMYMTTNYKQREVILGFFNELLKEGLIKPEEVQRKIREIEKWKIKNEFLLKS